MIPGGLVDMLSIARVPVHALAVIAVTAVLLGAGFGAGLPAAARAATTGAGTDTTVADPATASGIGGLSPADIASAYGLTGGISGATVAVVIPYHHPSLESDLGVYRAQFGLPACTIASGCLTVVSQRGGSDLPSTTDQDWALEESLDVDAVSAACPSCKILVVETDNRGMASLGTGVNMAVVLGAAAVSNSWTTPENSNASYYQGHYFTHPGVPIFAATGDAGYGTANMPASYSTVIAVGGTTLTRTAGASASARARDSSPDALQVTNGDAGPATTQSDLDRDTATLAAVQSDLDSSAGQVTTLQSQLDAANATAASLTAQQRDADATVTSLTARLAAANAAASAASARLTTSSARFAALTAAVTAAQTAVTSRAKIARAAATTLTRATGVRGAAKAVLTAKTRAYETRHDAARKKALTKARAAYSAATAAVAVARANSAAAVTALAAAQRTSDAATASARAARSVMAAHSVNVASARSDVSTSSSLLSAARSAAATVAAQLTAAQSAISSTQTDLSAAQDRVATLTAQVTAFTAQVQADRDALGTVTTPISVDTTPTPVATPTPTPTPVVTLTPSPNPTPTTTPTPTQTPTPTPTATAAPASRGWTETAWSSASSGCSTVIAKPTWQTNSACAGRASADVSAVGDPNTGLAVYDSFGYGGWLVVGGTSLATPLVAAMVVRSGHAANYSDASAIYAHSSAFYDITAGSNGSCGGTALCAAGTGWDGPTGIGTPKSLSSF